MQNLTAHLASGQDLADDMAAQAVEALASAGTSDESKAAFLRALRVKGESAAEIAAFVRALLLRAVDPGIDAASLPGPMIDVCGTGGDRLGMFNVSTTSMFVLAAGGAVVAKHGNRAVTSQCGGADVLEELGVGIEQSPESLRASLQNLGVGFVFAPAWHPAFKAIAPVRRVLAAEGFATVFNLLGPLLNPARPPFQLIGVFDPELLPKYAEVLTLLGRERAWAVSSAGADEILPYGTTQLWESTPRGAHRRAAIDPALLGIEPGVPEDLRGGDRAMNAAILVGILDGSITGGKRRTVLLNAAAGFVVAGLEEDLPAGLNRAREALDSRCALGKLEALRRHSPRLG